MYAPVGTLTSRAQKPIAQNPPTKLIRLTPPRLLLPRAQWLAASMKSFDVVVCLLPTDESNLALCELIGDMAPMLQYTRKRAERNPSPPQVVVAMGTPAAHAESLHVLQLAPLVLPRRTALASLVCEVLHPAAHWSGSLDREQSWDAVDASEEAAAEDGEAAGDGAHNVKKAASGVPSGAAEAFGKFTPPKSHRPNILSPSALLQGSSAPASRERSKSQPSTPASVEPAALL